MADPSDRVCSTRSSWHTSSITEVHRTSQEAGIADTELAGPVGCTARTVNMQVLGFWQS